MNRGVIFDLDGVLVASGPAHAASWRIVARRAGVEVSDERFRENFGRTSRDIVRLLWGPGLSEDDVRRIDAEKERTYRELVTGLVPVMIGARELLATLSRAGLKLAIATSGPPENLELVLREAGIDHRFAATVHGFDVARGKPAPDCFLLAAERLGLPPPACVVVEDAPVGLEAARRGGFATIALPGTHDADALRAAGATLVVRGLSDITVERVEELTRAAAPPAQAPPRAGIRASGGGGADR